MADVEKVERTPEEQALHDAHVAEMKSLGIEVSEPTKAPEAKKSDEGNEPPAPQQTPAQEPKQPEQPKAPEGAKEPGKDEAGGQKPTERPLKYIPIPQYQAEKDAHKKELADKDAQIAQLQAKLTERANSTGTDAEKGAIEEEVRALADEIGIEPEKAQKLINVARQGIKAPELPKEQQEALATIAQQNQEKREAELFNQQWDAFTPELQKRYPNATPAQLAEAKAEMDKISHTAGFEKYPLDYALFKNQETFDALLTRPQKRGAEPGALGKGGPQQPKERIRPDMATMTPEKLKEFERQMAEDLEAADAERPLTIQRNGETVRV